MTLLDFCGWLFLVGLPLAFGFAAVWHVRSVVKFDRENPHKYRSYWTGGDW